MLLRDGTRHSKNVCCRVGQYWSVYFRSWPLAVIAEVRSVDKPVIRALAQLRSYDGVTYQYWFAVRLPCSHLGSGSARLRGSHKWSPVMCGLVRPENRWPFGSTAARPELLGAA